MAICYLMDTSAFPIESANSKKEQKESNLMDKLLKTKLDRLKKEKVVSSYTVIQGTMLGFPAEKPCNTMIYRVDNVVQDLDKLIQKYGSKEEAKLEAELNAIRGWANAKIENPKEIKKIKEIRKRFYDNAKSFFGTADISRWTVELNELKGEDPKFKEEDNRGCKNKLAYEAFLAIIYGSGYIMTRAVVADKKLPQLEQALDGKYIRRTIKSKV